MLPEPPHALNTLHEGVEDALYRQSPGINQSGLKLLLRSPAHYQYSLTAPAKETPALRFGRLLHMAVLETERLAAAMVLRPDFPVTTKAGRESLQAWRQDLRPDQLEVTGTEHQKLLAILQSIDAHGRVRSLMRHGKRECSVWWQDPVHDVLCKARYDYVADRTGVIVDVKTTMNASPDSFARDAVTNHYGLQAAHYLAGARDGGVAHPKQYVWVAVEKEPPYGIGLYTLQPEEHQRAAQWRQRAMTLYAECLASGSWPGYSRDFIPLEPPGWAPKAYGPECPEAWF